MISYLNAPPKTLSQEYEPLTGYTLFGQEMAAANWVSYLFHPASDTRAIRRVQPCFTQHATHYGGALTSFRLILLCWAWSLQYWGLWKVWKWWGAEMEQWILYPEGRYITVQRTVHFLLRVSRHTCLLLLLNRHEWICFRSVLQDSPYFLWGKRSKTLLFPSSNFESLW